MFPDIRPINGLIVVACALLLAIALYMEYVMGLIPCPLCMTQRVFVLLVGVFALLAVVHHPRRWGRRVYAGFGLLADRKSTRLNSSHVAISYAVFCLKKN